MQCSPDPAGDEHIVFFVGWKRIFLEMESLMRLYRPFCGSDEVQTSNYREKNTGRNKVSPSKLPRIDNLKTVEANGISVFIFADLREIKNAYRLGMFLY